MAQVACECSYKPRSFSFWPVIATIFLLVFKYPILPFALFNFLFHTSYIIYDITVLCCITTFCELWMDQHHLSVEHTAELRAHEM